MYSDKLLILYIGWEVDGKARGNGSKTEDNNQNSCYDNLSNGIDLSLAYIVYCIFT